MSQSLSDRIASTYYRTTAVRSHQPTRAHYDKSATGLIRRIGRWLPPRGARCLDLGCGCGELIYALEQRGNINSCGVDTDARQIEEARHFVKADMVAGDVREFLQNCPTASFDFITALNFLEHFNRDDQLEILQQCRRVLRPRGTVVAMVPNAMSPFGSLTRHWDLTHEWAFTPNNFRQLLPLTGFDTVECRECGPVPHGFVS